jgi:hypothetical protein
MKILNASICLDIELPIVWKNFTKEHTNNELLWVYIISNQEIKIANQKTAPSKPFKWWSDQQNNRAQLSEACTTKRVRDWGAIRAANFVDVRLPNPEKCRCVKNCLKTAQNP